MHVHSRSLIWLSSGEDMKVCLYVNFVIWHHLPLPRLQQFVAIKITLSEAPVQ